MTTMIDKKRMYEDIKWYYSSKNFALDHALNYLEPLSTENQTALRFYYSQYFSSLCSGIEVVSSNPFGEDFKTCLYNNMTIAGVNGKEAILYVKELRNTLVHRGGDITSSAIFKDKLPLLVAPNVRDRHGSLIKPFHPFILQIIDECEEKIGKSIAEHIKKFDAQWPSLTLDEARKEAVIFINESGLIPEDGKNLAIQIINSESFLQTLNYPLQQLDEFLKLNFLRDLAKINTTLKSAIYS